MKKRILFAAFVAACLTTNAGIRDSRSNFNMPQRGSEHTMLRPENVKLPEGYLPHKQRQAQQRIDAGGFAPDASLVASNWSVIENEDGGYWFYTQEFGMGDNWNYSSSDFTIYNDRMEKQATVHFDAPEGENCNSIQPFGMITRKFFDLNEKTWEMLVYVHCTTADYTGKNYIYVINNEGEVLERFDGYSAQFLDYGSGFDAQRRLLVGGENAKTGKYSVGVYKKAGWNGGPSLEHTFEVDTELTNYSDGPAVNSFTIDNEPYYTLSHYEKPYTDGFDANWQPTVTPDNNYLVEVYDKNFQPVTTVKAPVLQSSNGFSMRTFGYFSYSDLNRSYNLDGSRKLDVIITNEDYFFNSAEDTYLYGWSVYNEDNEKINEFAGRAIDWWELSPIKGQPDQLALYTLDEEGSAHIEVYEVPSCEFVAGFDDTVEGLPISTAFDRAPVAGGYDYVSGINQGYSDGQGNVLGVVAWFTPEGKLDKRVNFNLGPYAQYFTAALTPTTLNPYIFNTDDKIEYLYRVKTGRGDGSDVLDDVIVIADSEGNTIRRFASDNTFNTLSSCDVLYNAEGKPFFLIAYYDSAYDDHFGETDINVYTLPFSKWPAGGTGTETDPYVITSVGDLMQIPDNPYGHYVVANDIDFSTVNTGWTPLPEFSGTLDGNKRVFRNFYIAADCNAYYSGLFSTLNSAKVSNLNFENPELCLSATTNYAGVLAGFASANTDVTRVGVINPRVSGSDYAGYFGTIASYAGAYVTATECLVEGADVSLPAASNVGGIFGLATASGVASACSVQGRIEGYTAVGGIIGGTLVNSYAVNCHADVELTADHYVGGIVGESSKRGTIDRNYAEGTVHATGADREGRLGAGGIVGYVEPYWGGENDNPVCAKQNLSAVRVEGAGTIIAAHRIAGCTVNDYTFTEEEMAEGKTLSEAGLVTNYSTADEAEGMLIGPNTVEGQTIATDDVDEEFLTKKLSFAFGDMPDAPWAFMGRPCLFAESYFTGIEHIRIDDASQIGNSAHRGIFDLQGRRYDAITAPGIYIIDGKKVVMQ